MCGIFVFIVELMTNVVTMVAVMLLFSLMLILVNYLGRSQAMDLMIAIARATQAGHITSFQIAVFRMVQVSRSLARTVLVMAGTLVDTMATS